MGNCDWDFKSKAQRSTAKISILIGKNKGKCRKETVEMREITEEKQDKTREKRDETKQITL